MNGVYPVIVDGRRLRIARHAVLRYQERVRPALEDPMAVLEELRGVLRFARFDEAPSWAAAHRTEHVWVLLGDEIAFPAEANVLVTCITRSGVGAELRIVRAKERKERPGSRKKSHGKRQRDERRRRRDAKAAQW